MNEQKELHFPTVAEQVKSFESKEKTMTVKEVANVFSVSEDTVKNCIRRIFPNKMQNGKLTCLNEEEVACISKELKSNSVVNSHLTYEVSSQVKKNTTKLEVIANYKSATEQLVLLLNTENTELKNQVATLKPQAQIANDFIDRNHLTNFRDASNILKIKQSAFMKILAEKYVYKNSIGEYRCYAEYEKYFSLRPFQKGIEKTGQQLMLTLDGLEFFKSKICEEVKS